MGLKAGPYESARAARTALVEAGYLDVPVKGRRPSKWRNKDPRKTATFAIQILEGDRAKIVPYPDLKRIDYRTTSDAERSSRTSLSRSTRTRPIAGAYAPISRVRGGGRYRSTGGGIERAA